MARRKSKQKGPEHTNGNSLGGHKDTETELKGGKKESLLPENDNIPNTLENRAIEEAKTIVKKLLMDYGIPQKRDHCYTSAAGTASVLSSAGDNLFLDDSRPVLSKASTFVTLGFGKLSIWFGFEGTNRQAIIAKFDRELIYYRSDVSRLEDKKERLEQLLRQFQDRNEQLLRQFQDRKEQLLRQFQDRKEQLLRQFQDKEEQLLRQFRFQKQLDSISSKLSMLQSTERAETKSDSTMRSRFKHLEKRFEQDKDNLDRKYASDKATMDLKYEKDKADLRGKYGTDKEDLIGKYKMDKEDLKQKYDCAKLETAIGQLHFQILRNTEVKYQIEELLGHRGEGSRPAQTGVDV